MIAKHVSMRSAGKSNFADLASYITESQGKAERLGAVRVTNCQAGTIQASIDEVLATQRMNTRATGDKTYHLIISFRAGENPPDDVLKAIEGRICAGLGFEDHQRISAVHKDTDNLHIHLAINKIHPTKGTMHEPYKAYRALAELCEKLEAEYGLEVDNHIATRTVAEGRAADMERHAGIESLITWVRRECLGEVLAAQSWDELHEILDKNGLELNARGNGLVVQSGDVQVKASSVSRDLSKPKLEGRLGGFKPGSNKNKPAEKRYEKKPVKSRTNTVELYARYKASQLDTAESQRKVLAQIKAVKDRKIKALKKDGSNRRTLIKAMKGGRLMKKILYARASQVMKADLKKVNEAYQRERAACYEENKRLAWADWLKHEAGKGDEEALAALRAREAAKGLKGNTLRSSNARQEDQDQQQAREYINVPYEEKDEAKALGAKWDLKEDSWYVPAGVELTAFSKWIKTVTPEMEEGGRGGRSQLKPVLDSVTKQGTKIYKLGADSIRDDGQRLKISKGATNSGFESALRMARDRYGDRIAVNGSLEFKARMIQAAVSSEIPITFIDPALEERRQQLIEEKKHEREQSGRRSGRANGVDGVRGRSTVNRSDSGIRSEYGRDIAGGDRGEWGVNSKPNIAGLGRKPPPQSQNRLRGMSELDLVRGSGGAAMLLPSDVYNHSQRKGTDTDNELRRSVSGAGLDKFKPEQVAAMDKYIEERQDKRQKGFDIPKHSYYTETLEPVVFAGTRNIDGQSLALLKQADEIKVLPIDEATARRLKRISIGDAVAVTPKGSIRTTKGRGR